MQAAFLTAALYQFVDLPDFADLRGGDAAPG